LKTLGKYLISSEIDLLKQLVGGECWFLRSQGLSVDFPSQICTASIFRINVFFNNEEVVKSFSFKNIWKEDPITLYDFHTLAINIVGKANKIDESNLGLRKKSRGLDSSISFPKIKIKKIQIYSREENIDNENVVKYDEALLFYDVDDNKILLSAKLDISDRVEFRYDNRSINERIKDLKMREEIN
jgi:hypothetical protein